MSGEDAEVIGEVYIRQALDETHPKSGEYYGTASTPTSNA